MNTERLTVAQALVRFLSHQYVERDGVTQRFFAGCWGIFGHGNVGGMGQALLEQEDLRFVQGRNEQAMVHAAVGYARQRDRLATYACTTSIGPGATNLVTGAALATINHLPVLLLPGDVFATRRVDPALQQLEQPHSGDVSVNDCLRPVSRYFDRIGRPEALVSAAYEAVRVLTDPVETGAVTLALPQDVQAEAYDWPVEFFADRVWRVPRPAPDPVALAEAAERVRAAERPLLIAGGGVQHSEAQAELRRFVWDTGIPVSETQAGKGSLRFDHPSTLGSIGHTGTSASNEMAQQADLVLGVGTRYSDFTTASRTLFARSDVRFVNINIASVDTVKNAAVPVLGDARTVLRQLSAELGDYQVDAAYRAEYQAAARRWATVVDRVTDPGVESEQPGQAQILGVLDNVLDDRDVLVNAAGSMPEDLNKLWRARDPHQYHVEYGYSCMGYEIPAAMGARLADETRHVCALIGDGSYLMLPGELVTAVQEGIDITVLLVQNHGYASIGGLSDKVGAERFATDYRYRTEHGRFDGAVLPVDLAANMRSLGVPVRSADTIEQLRSALHAARADRGPNAVHVTTDPAKTQLPPEAWWDVPVAEVANRASAQAARADYEQRRRDQRHHL